MTSTLSHDPDETRTRNWAEEFAPERHAAAGTEPRLTATSQNGAVTVTLRPDGGVTGVYFGDEARDIPLAELSALIVDTVHHAHAEITGHLGENPAAMARPPWLRTGARCQATV